MLRSAEPSSELFEEFSWKPYGPHSPALHALLAWLRTRPRPRKLILYREPNRLGFRLCELDLQSVQLHPVVEQPFATLEEAEQAALAIRWRESFGKEPGAVAGR